MDLPALTISNTETYNSSFAYYKFEHSKHEKCQNINCKNMIGASATSCDSYTIQFHTKDGTWKCGALLPTSYFSTIVLGLPKPKQVPESIIQYHTET